MLSPEEMKRVAGEYAVGFVQPGFVTGIGTGSTVYYFIHALAEKVKQGLDITAVVTSRKSGELSKQLGITVTDLNDVDTIDITIDGADEVDKQLQLIKGGGGALLQEKMVAAASKKLVIIADNTKLVSKLGHFPLPIEVIPYGWKQVQQKIREIYKIETQIRTKNNDLTVTDHGHYILDCYFNEIQNPPALNTDLHAIPGVVETGLFINMASEAIIGIADGSFQYLSK